jgi:ribosomal protein S18 acetylase RimI-like enzyme
MEPPEAALLGPQQRGEATATLGRAFQNYPLMEYTVPDEARRRRACTTLYGSIVNYTLRYGETYTTTGMEGAACWLPPDQPFPKFWRMVRAGMIAIPLRLRWVEYRRLQAVDHVAEARHREHAPGPHWYLWVIGVDPDHQRKGVAGRLMRPVFEKADRDQLRCYLETHKETNVAVYERYGFRVVSQTPIPGHPITMWGMLRSPGKGQPQLV